MALDDEYENTPDYGSGAGASLAYRQGQWTLPTTDYDVTQPEPAEAPTEEAPAPPAPTAPPPPEPTTAPAPTTGPATSTLAPRPTEPQLEPGQRSADDPFRPIYMNEEPAQEPTPEAGYISSGWGGFLKGGAQEVEKIANLTATGMRKVGSWTDQDWAKSAADWLDKSSKGLTEAAAKNAPVGDLSVKEAWDKGVIGPWITEKAAEGVLPLAELLTIGRFTGPWGLIAYGAAVGADREGRRPGSTPESIGAAAAEGGVMFAVPFGLAKTTENLGLFKRIVANVVGLGALGGAGEYTAPIPEAVASGEYKAPTGEQVATGLAAGAAQGAPFAAMGGRRAEPEKPPPATEEKPPATTGDPAVQAAAEAAVAPPNTRPVPPGAPPGVDQPMTPTGMPRVTVPTEAPPAVETNPLRARQQGLGQGYQTTPADFAAEGTTTPAPDTTGRVRGLGPATPGIDPAAKAALDATLPQGQEPPANTRPAPPGPPAGVDQPMTAPGMPRAAPTEPAAPPANPLRARQEGLTQGPTTPADFAAEGTVPPTPPDVNAPVPRVRGLGPTPPPVEAADQAPPNERPVPPAPPPGVNEPMAPSRMPRVTPPEPAPAAPTEPVNPLRERQRFPEQPTTPADFETERRIPTAPSPEELEPPGGRTIRRYTTEPDHENPNQHVAKDEAGNVVALGDTPEMAVEMARAREAAQARDAVRAGADTQPVSEGLAPTTGSEAAPAEAPAKPKASAKAKAKGAKITPAAAEVLDKAEAKQAAPPAPKAATGEVKAKPALVELVRKSLGVGKPKPVETAAQTTQRAADMAERERQAAKNAPAPKVQVPTHETLLQRAQRETLQQRAQRIAREVRADQAEAKRRPAKAADATRGMEDVGGRTAEEQAETAPARTREVQTVAEAEGRETSELKTDQRAASTTSLEAKASDLLHDHLEGNRGADGKPLTPMDAYDRYGEPSEGRGAPRKHDTFLDFLKDRIRIAKAPKAMDAINREAREINSDKSLTPEERSDRITRLADRLLAERGALDKMKAMQKAIEIGLRERAKPGASVSKSTSALDKMKAAIAARKRGDKPALMPNRPLTDLEKASAKALAEVTFNARRSEVSGPIAKRLVESFKRNVGFDIHDFLDDILTNPHAMANTPHLYELARMLKNLPRGAVRVAEWSVAGQDPSIRAGGFYLHDLIGVKLGQEGDTSHIEALLHEGTHAATLHFLRDIGDRIQAEKAGEVWPRLVTPEEHRVYGAMQALQRELNRMLKSSAPRTNIENFYTHYAAHGGSSPLTEMPTMLLTNPHTQAWARRTAPSKMLKADLTRLGMAPEETTTVWSSFKNAVRRMFGGRPESDNVLEWALRPLTESVDIGIKYRAEYPSVYGEEFPSRVGSVAAALRTAETRDTTSQRELTRQTRERLTDALPDPEARQRLQNFGDRVAYLKFNSTDDLKTALRRAKGDNLKILRSLGLPSMSTSSIAQYYRREAPFAEGIRDLRGKMQRAQQDVIEKHGDQVRGWYKQLKKAGDDFGNFLNDVTLAKASIGHADFDARNSHLNADELKVAQGLQQRYEAMPRHQQQLYQELRDFYQEIGWAERHAAADYAIDMGLSGGEHPITDEQRAQLRRVLRSKTELDNMLRNPDSSDYARAMGEAWAQNGAMTKEILRMHRRGWIDGDYFPLRRYGDWIVTTGDPLNPQETGHAVHFFERSSEAEAFRDGLIADKSGVQISPVIQKATHAAGYEALRGVLPERMLAQFESAATARGMNEEQRSTARDALAGTLMHYLTQSQGARLNLKRRGVAGASSDAGKVLANELTTHGARMGFLSHGAEENMAFGNAERYVKNLQQARSPATADEIAASRKRLSEAEAKFKDGDPAYSRAEIEDLRQQHGWLEKPPSTADQNAARSVLDELKARRGPIDGDESTKWLGAGARGFTTGSFIYHLIRPAQMLYQTLDAHANAQAFLGGRFGQARAGAALVRALKDIGPMGVGGTVRNSFRAAHGAMKESDWHFSDMFEKKLVSLGMAPERAKALMDAANDRGLINMSQMRELQRMSRPGAFQFENEKFAVGRNMMNLFAAANHGTDATNRMAILKAGYDLGMREHGNEARAIKEAVDLAERSMPNFSYWNKPRIATERSPLMRGNPFIALPMQYKIYGLNMYGTMASLVKQAVTRPEERAQAIKTLAGLFATHSLLVGATANAFGVPINLMTGLWDYITGKPGPHNYENDLRRWMTSTMGEPASTFLSRGALGSLGIDAHRSLKLSNMIDVPEIASFDRQGVTAALAQAAVGSSGELSEQIVQGFHHLFQGNIQRGAIELAPRMVSDVAKAIDLSHKGLTDTHGNPILRPEQIAASTPILKALGANPMQTAHAYDQRAAINEFEKEVDTARQVALDKFVQGDGSAVRAYNLNRGFGYPPISKQDLDNVRTRWLNRAKTPQTLGLAVSKRMLPGAVAAGQF
jgi:hypothetical protein